MVVQVSNQLLNLQSQHVLKQNCHIVLKEYATERYLCFQTGSLSCWQWGWVGYVWSAGEILEILWGSECVNAQSLQFECSNKQDIILLRESNFLCSGLDLLEVGIVEVEVEAGTQIQLFQLLHVKSCDVEHWRIVYSVDFWSQVIEHGLQECWRQIKVMVRYRSWVFTSD
jgi:hypothetical protein